MKMDLIKRALALSLMTVFLFFVSASNMTAFGSYQKYASSKLEKDRISLSTNCSPASLALVATTVAAGVAIVRGAYDFGTYVGEHLVNGFGESSLLPAVEYEHYNSTDFSEFNI